MNNVQTAIAAMKTILAEEIEFLIEDEGYDEDCDVNEAETVIFLQTLIERLENGWVPADYDECNVAAMGFYMATVGGMGYGDSDTTDHICEQLMQAFGIEFEEETA